MRRGVFWYYMERTGNVPQVKEEAEPALSPILSDVGGLLFKVTYYRRRINLEIFHALADGTGAFIFFINLVENYLSAAHPETYDRGMVESPDVSGREQESDGFTENFQRKIGSPLNFEFLGERGEVRRVYRFNEQKSPDLRQSVTEGWVSAARVHEAAKSMGATVTEFVCALLILAVRDTMPHHGDRYRKSVAVAVPVNLRRYFDSDTMRNFFGMIQITYDFSAPGEHRTEDVVASVKESFQKELTRENMEQKIASRWSGIPSCACARCF